MINAHCYGCGETAPVRPEHMADDLRAGRWATEAGKTYCPTCAAERGLAPPSSAADTAAHAQGMNRQAEGRSRRSSPAAFTVLLTLALVFTAIFVALLIAARSCEGDCEGVGYGPVMAFVPAIVFAILALAQGVRLLGDGYRDRGGS